MISKFQILENETIKNALLMIENNKKGFIFIIDNNQIVRGVVTDGDVRRALIKEHSLNDKIKLISNKNFIYADINSTREDLLKKLDYKIKFIPILTSDGRLEKIITKDDLPIDKEASVLIRAKSPVRISFSGGGSDTTNYFELNDGATLNATISLYAHASLRIRSDKKISVNSLDLNKKIEAKNLKSFLKLKNQFGLIQSLLKLLNPNFGFDLLLYSDFNMKSGLGGSSAVISSIIGCFNECRIDQWSLHEMAELSFQAERLSFNVAGGWQDQYATVFGGLNFMEFNKVRNTIHPLRLPSNISSELEESLMLFDTCISHESNEIHLDQKKETKKIQVTNIIKSNVELAYKMRNYLLKGELSNFGKMLDLAWKNKKSLSKKISSNFLDKVYKEGIKNGALGGKLLGAGGGGCFLFYVKPEDRNRIIKIMNDLGLKLIPFVFENKGINSWKIRQVK